MLFPEESIAIVGDGVNGQALQTIYMELITSREEIVLYVTLLKEIGALPTGG